MPEPDAEALLLALCEKHEELREPCPRKDRGDGYCVDGKRQWFSATQPEGECPSCVGRAWVPLTGPALLAGLFAAMKASRPVMHWRLEEQCGMWSMHGRYGAFAEVWYYMEGVCHGPFSNDPANTEDGPTEALTLALASAEGLTGGA